MDKIEVGKNWKIYKIIFGAIMLASFIFTYLLAINGGIGYFKYPKSFITHLPITIPLYFVTGYFAYKFSHNKSAWLKSIIVFFWFIYIGPILGLMLVNKERNRLNV